MVVFRVLDPAELTFDFARPAMFQDLESGRQLYVDPEAVRGDYLRRFQEHAAATTEMCNALGIDFTQLSTERPLELALFDFLRARSRRGRPTGRRAAAARRNV